MLLVLLLESRAIRQMDSRIEYGPCRLGTLYTLAERRLGLEILNAVSWRCSSRRVGEQDPQAVGGTSRSPTYDELVSPAPSPESPSEEFPDRSTEMIQELVDELGNLHSEVGRLRNR